MRLSRQHSARKNQWVTQENAPEAASEAGRVDWKNQELSVGRRLRVLRRYHSQRQGVVRCHGELRKILQEGARKTSTLGVSSNLAERFTGSCAQAKGRKENTVESPGRASYRRACPAEHRGDSGKLRGLGGMTCKTEDSYSSVLVIEYYILTSHMAEQNDRSSLTPK